MTDMRTMLEADRESMLDTADWLNRLDQEAFDRHVLAELRGILDPEACEALRHRVNLRRWETSLRDLYTDLQRQLSLPAGKVPERADWRKRTINFLAMVGKRRSEVTHLRKQQRVRSLAEAEQRKANQPLRSEAGDRAIQRLIDAHRSEFLTLMAEEYRTAGLEPSEKQLQELAELRVGEDLP